MTDVTAQAFREAAADLVNACHSGLCSHCFDLLLAAAEQREQADARDEIHTLQLAAIMTASIQNTPGTRQERIARDHPYWSVAYSDVCVAIDREIALREQLEAEKANTELQSHGRRLAEDNQIRAYRLRDEAAEQIATLTAEREALKADILYMAREAGNEMPPEEALAKLRAARIESEES